MYLPPNSQGPVTSGSIQAGSIGLGGSPDFGRSLRTESNDKSDPRNKLHGALDYTDELVVMTIKALQELETRLSAILEPTGPTNSTNGLPASSGANSPITERVATINAGLITVQGQLSNLFRRLEV